MLIEITGPVFKCEEDKNIFLSRLYAIPNDAAVSVKAFNYYLTVNELSKQVDLQELQAICDMWGTSFKVLEE